MIKKIKLFAILLLITFLCSGIIFASHPVNPVPAYAVSYSVGSSGSTVKTIQKKLKNWGYYSGAVDGIYGPKTKAAMRSGLWSATPRCRSAWKC